LLVDTTTTTGLKYGSTTLTATHIIPPQPPVVNITGYTYTNPNVTVTTSAAHGFGVGQRVRIIGMITAGTSGIGSTARAITAVGSATTFTFNLGTTDPGAYTSGGVAFADQGSEIVGMRYTTVGGRYFILFNRGQYFYSSDAITWNIGFLPDGQKITGVDYDGTTFVMCNNNGQIYTSTTAAIGSWTQRFTNASYTFTGVRWCGGNTNRWVAYGNSSGAQTLPGTQAVVVVATTATGTWTAASIGGTNPATGFVSLAFDNNLTIALTAGSQMAVTTNGTGTWTGYSNQVTHSPNDVAGQIGLNGPSSYPLLLWNSVASKWMAIGSSDNANTGTSTAGSPASPWTKSFSNSFVKGAYFTSGAESTFYLDTYQHAFIDAATQRIYSWDSHGTGLNIYTYNANPTSINNFVENYPLISVQQVPNVPSGFFQNADTGTSGKRNRAMYGNGKWVHYTTFVGTSTNWVTNGLITVIQ
jgi:hypothetical protein